MNKNIYKIYNSTRSKIQNSSPLVSRVDKGSRDDSKDVSLNYVDTPNQDKELQSYSSSYNAHMINAQKELRIFTTSVHND